MLLIQTILVVFSLYMLSRVALRFREGYMDPVHVFFWSAAWVCVIVVALLPQMTSYVAALVGVGRGADLVMYTSLVALFYLMFRMFLYMKQMERCITALVRDSALRNAGLSEDDRAPGTNI